MEAYLEGFWRSDHEAILACLADDVVWVLHGYRTLRGKQAFDGEIENDAAVGSCDANGLCQRERTILVGGCEQLMSPLGNHVCSRRHPARRSDRRMP